MLARGAFLHFSKLKENKGRNTEEESDTTTLTVELGMASENTCPTHPLPHYPGKLQIQKLFVWSLPPIT